jgi:hypothetical protein
MFLPGSPCGCCGPCQPCPRCAPLCLTATFSGFAHGTENCNECSFLDDVTFQLKRPPDPTLSVTASVPSATGSGATFSVTTARSTTDGSYSVTGIKLTNGGVNYSIGDKVAFSSNGCITEPPEATITIATTQPQSKMNLPGVGNTDVLSLTTGGAVVPGVGGAVVPVTYQQQAAEDGNPYWSVASMGQPFAGAGYSAMQVVNLSPEAGVVVVEPATARITEVNRSIPSLGVRIHRAGGGTFDGGLVVGRAQSVDANGRFVWSASSVGIGWWFPSDFTAADTVSFYTSGTTATTVRAATATIAVNENGAITSFTITDGGEYYDTNGVPLAAELLTAGKYYKPGVITAVTLVSGGQIFGPNACNYLSDRVCSVCPDNYGGTLQMSLSLGATNHTMTVVRRAANNAATTLLEASRPAVDDDGNPISCTDLTFEPEHFSGQYSCMTNGTVTIGEGACGDSSQGGCDLPVQVSISASGIPLIFGHGGSGGGSNSGIFVPGLADHCGITKYCTASTSVGGGLGNVASISLLSRDESGVILEGGRDQSCLINYSGVMPDLPVGSVDRGFNWVGKNCGGSLSGGRAASISIGATTAFTNVTISPPSWGSYGATAEASVGGGQVTGITVTNSGEGYAREIFTRTEPGMTVTLSGGAGSGAVLEATLTQSGAGESATWGVSSVAVNSGGTGYAGNEAVVFTPEEGATTDYPASAYIVVGRVEPTVTASVSGGSDAVLSVVLAQSTDWNGLAIWYVESVTVVNGGTGYTDGDPVTFAVTDGTASYNASGSISVTDGIITGVNVDWWNVGEYYKSTGVIESVVIWEPGVYYLSESTGTSQVDTPTVTIGSNAGEGATATATVDGSVGSETFGQITGISVTSGGSGYLAAVPMWQVTLNYDGLAHASVSDRVTTDPCPTALLNRSYAMSASFASIPAFFGNGCGEPDAVIDNKNGTNTYRFDGITISVSAA